LFRGNNFVSYMPITDHSAVLDNLWMAVGISVVTGGLAAGVSSSLGDLGFGSKAIVAIGIACIFFGMMYFFAPTGG
jgi:uncharacterized protein (DUF2062 family)